MSGTRGDAGLTLVETMMSVLLSAIVGGVLTTAIVVSFHRQSEIEARAAGINTVRQAFERTMREIRGAEPLLSVTDNQLMMMETNAAGVQRTLSYSLVTTGGNVALVVDETDVDANNNALPAPPRRVVAGHLVNVTKGIPVFSVSKAVDGWGAGTSTVDALCHVIGTSNPNVYAPDCIGGLVVHLVIDPVRRTGTSTCAGTASALGSGTDCYIDVMDNADIRNSTP